MFCSNIDFDRIECMQNPIHLDFGTKPSISHKQLWVTVKKGDL